MIFYSSKFSLQLIDSQEFVSNEKHFIKYAGAPATIEKSGNDRVTTELEPTTQFFPKVTPGNIHA